MSYGNEREKFRTKVCPFLIVNDSDTDFVDVGCYGPMCMWYRASWINSDGSVGACGMIANGEELNNKLSLLNESVSLIGR